MNLQFSEKRKQAQGFTSIESHKLTNLNFWHVGITIIRNNCFNFIKKSFYTYIVWVLLDNVNIDIIQI